MKRISLIASVVSLLVVTSCAKKPESTQPGPIVQGAKIETVKTSSVDDYYEAVGTVRAKNSTVVAANTPVVIQPTVANVVLLWNLMQTSVTRALVRIAPPCPDRSAARAARGSARAGG